MKRICSAALCLLLALCFMGTAAAAQAAVRYELNVPSQIAAGKSVTVNIMLSCGQECGLGAMLFLLEYDPDILTYRETKLSAGAPGELRAYAENGKIKMVYLNTAGTMLGSTPRDLISVRFTAPSGECSTPLVLSGLQAANAQEQKLACEDPVGYGVSVLKKPDANAAPAKGTRQKSTSSGASASYSKGNTPSRITGSADDGVYADPWEQGGDNGIQDGVFSAGGNHAGVNLFEDNGFFVFLCGLGGAAVLLALLYGAYRLGIKKKQGAGKTEDTANQPGTENGDGKQPGTPEEKK